MQYITVYPDRVIDLLLVNKDYTYYDSCHRVLPRRKKYVLTDNGVRQYRAVEKVPEKERMMEERIEQPTKVRTDYGRGEIYYCTLLSRLICLLINKMASLDPFGIGVEMEADKPGWCDALNGLPGLFGSSLNISLEIRRLAGMLLEIFEVLGQDGAELDTTLDKSHENFTVYEEGNEDGRFFFIRNMDKEAKTLGIKIDQALRGEEYNFSTIVQGRETRLLPVNFTVPGTEILINYSTSEILLSKDYNEEKVFVLYGKKASKGQLNLNLKPDEIKVIKGNIKIRSDKEGSLLEYIHDDILIIKIANLYLFILEEQLIGKIEELAWGLLFHNLYYLEDIKEDKDLLELKAQICEGDSSRIRIFPIKEGVIPEKLNFEGKTYQFNLNGNLYETDINSGEFVDRPVFKWTSDWTYTADSEEIKAGYDHSDWIKLAKPVSLEEADLIEHGYYWYRTEFEIDSLPEKVFMDYHHNNTDRMFIYLNEKLVYKSHNKKIKEMDITAALKEGKNTMAILYANEFHNKSQPHEGELIKFSGIMNPFRIYGEEFTLTIESFYVQQGLSGLREGFHQPDYNDQNWNKAPEAKKYVPTEEMGHIIWFRRKFKYDLADPNLAPLYFKTKEADQRLTIYINGKPVARYDILGPQEEFYIPPGYLRSGEENLIAIILEGPAFYDELQSGYRRAYMYQPVLEPAYMAKKVRLTVK